MVQLRSVDVLSCAKIYGILHVAIGIVFALFFVFIGLIGFAASPGATKARHDCHSAYCSPVAFRVRSDWLCGRRPIDGAALQLDRRLSGRNQNGT